VTHNERGATMCKSHHLVVLCVFLFFISAFQAFASNSLESSSLSEMRDKSVLNFPNKDLYDDIDLRILIKRVVPSRYVDTFLYYTSDSDAYTTDVYRLWLLSLGKKESNWEKTKSDKPNSNGTWDYGFIQVNESNIENPVFVAQFGPKATDAHTVIDEIDFYLILGINYFKSLYKQYGCDAIYAYNAGEDRYTHDRIPRSTYRYKYDIKRINDGFINQLYIEHNERLEIEAQFAALVNATYANKEIAKGYIAKIKSAIENGSISVFDHFETLNIVGPNLRITQSLLDGIMYDPKKEIDKFLNPCFIFNCNKGKDDDIDSVFKYIEKHGLKTKTYSVYDI
jgi:hypothetical protein